MDTTDDIAFIVFNNGDVLDCINEHLYNPSNVFVVEVVEDSWVKRNMFFWNYERRVIITPSANVKPTWMNNDEMKFIRYQDLAELGKGIQESILNQLKRFLIDK